MISSFNLTYLKYLPNDNLYLPEIGILRLTCFGYRMRYNDKATTWWHQKISFVSQLQDTFVILQTISYMNNAGLMSRDYLNLITEFILPLCFVFLFNKNVSLIE